MPAFQQLSKGFRAARELGWSAVFPFALYQFSLRSGTLRRKTAPHPASHAPPGFIFPGLFHIPDGQELQILLGNKAAEVIRDADEIVAGQVRLFGGPPVPLNLTPPLPLRHWTQYKDSDGPQGDIKLTWEPARFGFAFTLGRAYILSREDAYAQSFWEYLETFLESNPPNMGPNWVSAQEAALRILAFAFAGQVFAASPHSSPARQQRLAGAVADLARRIPPTLSYALSQNNNHLITEALGLFLAGWLLTHGAPGDAVNNPTFAGWAKTGWRWLNLALQRQIDADGTYAQHSVNYHRLMLHAALIGQQIAKIQGLEYPTPTREKLAAAAAWLHANTDEISGLAVNLGHNDGSRILPLYQGDFLDQRAVLQAAARAFLGSPCEPPGSWDELSLWLGLLPKTTDTPKPVPVSPAVQRIGDSRRWASMRTARFHSRPAHADQLHIELWSDGLNLALDAGSYRYTAGAPWQNALAATMVHNTVSLMDADQMQRAGKFLWLDWAQSQVLPSSEANQVIAQHDGYRRLGLIHRRSLERITPERWLIRDSILPRLGTAQPCTAVLHWLLPDYPWQLSASALTLDSPLGDIVIRAAADSAGLSADWVQVIRAGEVQAGPPDAPQILGWFSPTYNVRRPALSFRIAFTGQPPFQFITEWLFSSISQPQSEGVK